MFGLQIKSTFRYYEVDVKLFQNMCRHLYQYDFRCKSVALLKLCT